MLKEHSLLYSFQHLFHSCATVLFAASVFCILKKEITTKEIYLDKFIEWNPLVKDKDGLRC